jgi:hypothetical protein
LANIASVPEDLIEIQVFGVDQLARTVRVNSFGMVSLPSSAPRPWAA